MGLKRKKDFTTQQMSEKKYNSFYNNKDRLRIAQLINDPYKIKYLYKADLWKDNQEAFDTFKSKYLLKMNDNIDEINKLNKSKSKSKSFLQPSEKLTSIQEENEEEEVGSEMNFNEVSNIISSKLSGDDDEYKVSSYIDDGICNDILEKFSKKILVDDPEYNKYKNALKKEK